MTNVTDADREKARLVVGVWKHTGDDLAEIIAAQLADARKKARAPFLALADEAELEAGEVWLYPGQTHPIAIVTADRIRRAAEDI